jgi:hypothetical protein
MVVLLPPPCHDDAGVERIYDKIRYILINMKRTGNARENRYQAFIMHKVGGQEAASILGWARGMAGSRDGSSMGSEERQQRSGHTTGVSAAIMCSAVRTP